MSDASFFTVAWLRQLPQAIELAASLARVYPGQCLHVGLVDSTENLPENLPENLRIHPVASIKLPDFNGLIQKYSQTEFRNLTKPFFAKYLLDTFPDTTQLIYLSPESVVLAPLDTLLRALNTHAIALVSQLTVPPNGRNLATEGHFLNVGTYDAGLWGVRRGGVASSFLSWWAASLHQRGWLRLCQGYGSDQLWLDLVPAFFDEVLLIRQPDYVLRIAYGLRANVAGSTVVVNFEGIDPDTWPTPDRVLSKEVKNRIAEYRHRVNSRAIHQTTRKIAPAFGTADPSPPAPLWRRQLARPVRWFIQFIDKFQPDFLSENATQS
ncbi:MAG: hypothetical protein LH606_07775 [Cytophagaceae bacterium]|nr:hypothetical protein [Cytophagaceae bacterium]